MTDLTDAEIELRKLAAAATPGEWKWLRDGHLWTYLDGRNEEIIWPDNVPAGPDRTWAETLGACGHRAEDDAEANAAYIAAANPARVLALLDALVAAREALGKAAQQFRWYEASHVAKSAPDKAASNRRMAEMCERAALPQARAAEEGRE